jgi:hypothetical protein
MATQKYASKKDDGTLQRPRYATGLLLEADDLTAAVTYTRDMMRLVLRSLFGCGVICGLDVTAEIRCSRTEVDVTIGKGVALDCLGDPIEVPKPVKVTFDNDCDVVPEWLWVTVCYSDKCCRPKDTSCTIDEHGEIVHTRIKDGFEVRVYPKRPKCACSCEPPDPGQKSSRDCCDDDDVDPRQAAAEAAATAGSVVEPAAAAVPLSATRILVRQPGPGGQIERQEPTLPDLCDCYQNHYDGKCECNCCCPCVLVAKVHTTIRDDGQTEVDPNATDPQGLQINRDWVRWIRPVLTGYYKCVKQVMQVR